MNVEAAFDYSRSAGLSQGNPLLAHATRAFMPMVDEFRSLDGIVDQLAEVGGQKVSTRARKIKRRLWRDAPTVTMIGQVKAGKTSLVNAMIGQPGLLPADINPWTSVVTSVHLTPHKPSDGTQAVFQFFDREQWDRLISKGGRIGELAGRAGASDEVAKISTQLAAMREKSMARLGGKFELLMGQQHRYGYVDPELVQRYVCLGDDFENDFDTSRTRGRFADITKAADLLVHEPTVSMGLCIRDTPGVNDTFLMREQVTIRAIRESRTCVVVLSAHQAMSTVDVALLRLIASIPSRELVIFVNRIDELSDPSNNIREIETNIRQVLRNHHGPQGATILFGSAYWANNAVGGTVSQINDESLAALQNWAASSASGNLASKAGSGEFTQEDVWQLSGVPALYQALADRVEQSFGAETVETVARAAWNLASTLETETRTPQIRQKHGKVVSMNRVAVPAELDRLQDSIWERLDHEFEILNADFHRRIDRANASFVDRAVASLVRHLERSSGEINWKYDPTGLRMLLRTAFTVYRKRAYGVAEEAFFEAAEGISDIYVRSFNLDGRTFSLEPPTLPSIGMPVLLAETIALDLEGNWWSRWWKRRRGYEAYRSDFVDLIAGETATLVNGLKAEYGPPDQANMKQILGEFFDEQRKILLDMWIRKDVSIEDMKLQLIRDETRHKASTLAEAKQKLKEHLGKNEGKT